MRSEFKEFLLSDLGTLDRGKSRHRPRYAEHLYGGTYPFIQTGDIKAAGGRVSTFTQTYSEAGLAQSRLWPADTLCITIAANIAETALLTFPACFPDSIVGFIANNARCDVRYIEYWFRAFRESVRQRSYGTVQENINLEVLRGLKIALPSLETQRQVADSLSQLDDRIELLRQTNATLESIAQALFKSWFIDFDPVRAKAEGREPEGMDAATAALFPAEFEESELGLIPKGWGVHRVSDVLELAYGKALKATDRREGLVPVYGSGGITGFHDEALVQTCSIIVGRKGTVGSLYWEDKPFFPIDTTFYVKPKAAPLTFCFYALQRLGLESMNTDAAVPGLNRENAYRLKLTTSPSAVLMAFDDLASTLRGTMRCNDEQAALIASLRDTLLPRLISGKLRLPEAQAQLQDTLG